MSVTASYLFISIILLKFICKTVQRSLVFISVKFYAPTQTKEKHTQ